MLRALWRHTSVKILTVSLLAAVLLVGLLAVRVLNPTFTWNGRVLSAQEFRALV